MQRKSSAKAKLGWSRLRNKRGVTNIVLMMGVALAMAILLIGGASVVSKFVQVQAQSSPKFIATELTTLINTVQAAPETVTFDYYTAMSPDGYPVIGSLEIDDNKNMLCVGPKTEGEIFGSIIDQAAVGAGFGAIGFAKNRVENAAAAKAARTAAVDSVLFGDFIEKSGLSKKMLYTVGVGNSEKSQLARKFLQDKKFSAEEEAAFEKYFSKVEIKQLESSKGKMTPQMKSTFFAIDKNEEVKAEGLLSKLKSKLPGTAEREESKFGQRGEAFFAREGESPSVLKRVGGTLSKTKAHVGGLALAGGFAAFNFWMTGGDWTSTILTFVQMTIMNYMPKLIEFIVGQIVKRFGVKLAEYVPISVVQATAYKLTGEACKDDPEPLSKAITCAAAALAKVVEVVSNVAFSVYNTVTIDMTLSQIHGAASHQVAVERNSIDCEKFVAPKKVLLTPPNCEPEVDYGSTFESYQAIGTGTFWATAIGLWEATGWAAATAYVPSAGLVHTIQANGILALTMVPAYASLAYTVAKDPTGLVPRPGCSSSCDTTYMRQDCPNWFLAAPGLASTGSKIGGYSFEILLNGGPICAGLSLTGMAGTLCNAARVTTAMAIFLTGPSEIYEFFLHTDEVGLTKTVANKTALEFPDLPGAFADNTGYWYAEFPSVIELNKVYTNDSSSSKRNPPLIIRKV